jgi:type IV secretory pathway VirB2 component (pilin)
LADGRRLQIGAALGTRKRVAPQQEGNAMSDLFNLEMSIHGWIALGIAVVGIIALNLGLMHLARKKHDSSFDPHDDAP